MKDLKEIRDDQIRIIGEEGNRKPISRGVWIITIFISVVGIAMLIILGDKEEQQEIMEGEPALFEPIIVTEPTLMGKIGNKSVASNTGFTEIKDTLINDVSIRIYIPHNAEMSLHIGKIDSGDTSIVYAAQAADIRADNGGIVGAFVLKGEPKAWGLSKKGFCASINGKITIGVAENSPLFEKATEEGGYFFRQYPLVSKGELIENEPKGKSIRRAICDRQGEIFMVETESIESFHDFAQALVDLGVDQAIYLVGSTAFGWAVDETGETHEFGDKNFYTGRRKMPQNINYIVWKRR